MGEQDLTNIECHREQFIRWKRGDYQSENNRHERKPEDKCDGISEQKHVNGTWSD